MTRITKDYPSLLSDQCKKKLYYIAGHKFLFPSIDRESSHLNCLVKSPTYKIHFIKSPRFTSVLIISRYDTFSICTRSICSLKIFKEGNFLEVNL